MPGGTTGGKIDPPPGARQPDTMLGELLGDWLGDKGSGMVEHFYQEFPPPDPPPTDWNSDPANPAESAPQAPAWPGTPL